MDKFIVFLQEMMELLILAEFMALVMALVTLQNMQ
jgi:hypothetical protein